MSCHIYISVCQTGTNIAKILKIFTRKPYNHVSVFSDPTHGEMYSFCRNKPSRPLPATFNKEIVGKGTLGKFSFIPCEIYKLDVTEEQKNALKKILNFLKTTEIVFHITVLDLD